MTDAITFGRSLLVMFSMFVFGALMAYAVGMAHDMIVSMLIGLGIDGGQGTSWDSTRSIYVLTALMYFICCLPPAFGIIQFALVVTKRNRRDAYYEAGAIYGLDEGGSDWR